MAFEAKIRVVGLGRIDEAKTLVNDGEYKRAAAVLNDFCWKNGALQGEHGEVWGDIKLTALQLIDATADKVARIMRPLTRMYDSMTEKARF